MLKPDPSTDRAAQAAKPKTPWRRRLLRWGIDLVIALAVFQLISWWQARDLPETGGPPPAVTFTDLQGRPHTLDELKGRHVWLHFWATWCGVCKMEYGTLNAVHGGLDDDEALIAVAADGEDLARLKAYVAEAGIEYPVWVAEPAAVQAFKVSSFPTNFYLDPDGMLSSRDVGVTSRLGARARLGCAGL